MQELTMQEALPNLLLQVYVSCYIVLKIKKYVDSYPIRQAVFSGGCQHWQV